MFLSVRDMETRPIVVATAFAPGEVDWLEPNLTQVGDLSVQARAEWLELIEEARLGGSLSVKIGFLCERCLEPGTVDLDHPFQLVYRPDTGQETAGEVAIAGEEAEIGFFDGIAIDLKEVLREQVLLALPMQRLCSEDCCGLCPQCGVNWNERDCSCAEVKIDERWLALRQLAPPAKSR